MVVQAKFMGDGALYILTMPPGPPGLYEAAIADLTNRLWHLKEVFPALLKKCAD